jgi:hypothetical protein
VTVELTSLKPVLPALASTGQKPVQIITGNPAPSSAPGSGAPSSLAAIPDFSLKDGLSATVNILVQQQNNVLLIPNRAISRQGRNSVVQLVKGTTTEAVAIQTGISDSTNTEVISGLNEGDRIALPSSSSSSSNSNLSKGGPVLNAVPAVPMEGNTQYQIITK